MGHRSAVCGGGEAAHRRAFGHRPRGAEALTSSARGCTDRDIARRALLQQQLAGLYHRLAMKPFAHPAMMQRVGDGDDGHALVMGHVARTIATSSSVRKSRAGEIERFVKAIAASCADLGEPRVVRAARLADPPSRRGRSHKARSPHCPRARA